jgi:O-antigen/teichoic acid export membrane protein
VINRLALPRSQSRTMNPTETATEASRAHTLKIGSKVLARNAVLNVAGQVVPLLVGVATMPYVIRHLGPDRFGLLSLAWIVVAYLGLFDLGIGPATTKFVAELLGKDDIEKLPALVWTALVTQSGFGLLAGILLAAASPTFVDRLLKIPPGLRPDAHWMFLILAVSVPINFAGGSLRGVLAASQRFDLLNAIGIPSSALGYLIPAGALALGFDLRGIVLFLVLSRVAGLGASSFFCLRLYPALGRRCAFDRSLVRCLLGFGGWVTVSDAISPILVSFDRFLIGALRSIAAVGFYTPCYMISTRLGILPQSLAATLYPAFSTSAGRGDSEWIKSALVRSLKYLLLLVGPAALVLVFFARPFLTLWLGAKFADEGALVLQILAVGVLINSLAFVPYHLLRGLGRPDLTAKFHLLEVPLHVALAWFLVTAFGLPGAALAWTLRVSLDFLLLIVAACWISRTSPRLLVGRQIRRSVATLTALAVSLSVLWAISHALLANALLALLLTTGFLVGTWHYVLDLEEKWHIRLWLKAAL